MKDWTIPYAVYKIGLSRMQYARLGYPVCSMQDWAILHTMFNRDTGIPTCWVKNMRMDVDARRLSTPVG